MGPFLKSKIFKLNIFLTIKEHENRNEQHPFQPQHIFWYVEENASPDFKEALKNHGFVDAGIFRGVIGPLHKPIVSTPIPDDCALEMVQD